MSGTHLVQDGEEEGVHGGTVEDAVQLGVRRVHLARHLVRRPGSVLPFVGTRGPHAENKNTR